MTAVQKGVEPFSSWRSKETKHAGVVAALGRSSRSAYGRVGIYQRGRANPTQYAPCMPDLVDRGLAVLNFISVLFTNPRSWEGFPAVGVSQVPDPHLRDAERLRSPGINTVSSQPKHGFRWGKARFWTLSGHLRFEFRITLRCWES